MNDENQSTKNKECKTQKRLQQVSPKSQEMENFIALGRKKRQKNKKQNLFANFKDSEIND